jgi:high affinity Mn2+ porin
VKSLVLLLAFAGVAHADDAYVLDHPSAPWWLSGQVNLITQAQPGFHSPYAGANSLVPGDHDESSYVATLFAGYEIVPRILSVVVTGESAGGGGLSTALGLAGFTNLDVVRNPTLGAAPYVGRAYVDAIIPLDDASAPADRNPLRIFRTLPAHRIEIRAGKLSTVDMFDVNAIGTDSHLQFMNWAIDNNGAYDYAADTRGYTLGAEIEYATPLWTVRYGAMLMPTVANGIDYDFDLANARGENLEVELHDCIAGHPGIVRLLGYWNHANMGNYDDANAIGRLDPTVPPDITMTRIKGRTKLGFGVNVEHEVGHDARVFARVGWSDGKNESFAYTEIDNTVLAGGDIKLGDGKLGVALVTNGLSKSHADYLGLGGKGFLLGDGQLNYGREDIAEIYFTYKAYRGVFPAADVQAIAHPGYNVDRGPVLVGSLRLHVEI